MAELIPPEVELLDIGSGAGLPGLVIALARPDLKITLLEPLLRRATMLSEFIAELGLEGRVRVVRERAEEHKQQYRYVTARAVASLTKLLPMAWPLLSPGGVLLAMKGEGAAREVEEAAALLAKLKVRQVEVVETRGYPEAPQPGRVIRIER
ncbi:ribosomal RNA small subunit methyltransferase G [mine drainage metagenome]|uniref:Ribosomal RNA small subunit methyltransferase G n=1 Tax=mine drainage metagenome TaxID=410659 RepID=A0A1J5PUD4_9ZZZZ